MYYRFDVAEDQEYGVVREPKLPDGVDFLAPVKIEGELPSKLVFEVDNTRDHPPDDLLRLTTPIMSDRMLTCLRAAGVDNLQSFPCRLLNPDTGETWTGYNAVNIIGSVKCANMDESEFGDPTGSGMIAVMFDRLVLDSKATHGELMFRLAESLHTMLAHESVGNALDDCEPELTGYDLEEIEEV